MDRRIHLANFTAPVSEFHVLIFDESGFDTTTDIYGTEYDGSTLSPAPTVNIDINPPLTSRPGGFDLRAPYYSPNHPQERLAFASDDGLQLIVTAGADAGGPPQIIKTFNVASVSSPATLFFDLIAQAATGVMVFYDGVRKVLGTDFTVDHLSRTVTVTFSGVTYVSIHAFGFGESGTAPANEQHFIAFSANPIVLNAAATLSDVAVVEDGVLLSSGYTVSGANVTITSPPSAGTDVAVIVYEGGTLPLRQ